MVDHCTSPFLRPQKSIIEVILPLTESDACLKHRRNAPRNIGGRNARFAAKQRSG